MPCACGVWCAASVLLLLRLQLSGGLPALPTKGAGGRVFGSSAAPGRHRPTQANGAAGSGKPPPIAGVVERRSSPGRRRPAIAGEEEGVVAAGGGIEEAGAFASRPLGDQADAAGRLRAAAAPRRLPLVDIGARVGVGGDEAVGGVEEDAVPSSREDPGLVERRGGAVGDARRGCVAEPAGVRRSGCRRRRAGRRPPAAVDVEVELGVGRTGVGVDVVVAGRVRRSRGRRGGCRRR